MKASAAALSVHERHRLLELVDRRFGIRGSQYGATHLDDAIRQVLPGAEPGAVTALLESLGESDHPRWLYELVEYLTVGETYFLRNPAQIAALRDQVLPDLLARRNAERRLQLWSAGCSTGEEVYTLAILLHQAGFGSGWDVSLIGTDVNRESLRLARDGCYPAWSFRATPTHVRDRYFEPVSATGWRLIEPLRHMARFAWMNLGANPLLPPGRDLDLIVCRNVTIYFDDEATQRLYRVLIDTLAPGGWLMLGPSDPLPLDRRGLERLDSAEAVLWQKVAEAKPMATPQSAPPALHKRAQPISKPEVVAPQRDGHEDLEAGLLALEAGSSAAAVEWLRRATFRDPDSALAQFALARAYLDTADLPRAHAALLHTRKLLARLAADAFVPGSDSLSVETLRQTVETHLQGIAA